MNSSSNLPTSSSFFTSIAIIGVNQIVLQAISNYLPDSEFRTKIIELDIESTQPLFSNADILLLTHTDCVIFDMSHSQMPIKRLINELKPHCDDLSTIGLYDEKRVDLSFEEIYDCLKLVSIDIDPDSLIDEIHTIIRKKNTK